MSTGWRCVSRSRSAAFSWAIGRTGGRLRVVSPPCRGRAGRRCVAGLPIRVWTSSIARSASDVVHRIAVATICAELLPGCRARGSGCRTGRRCSRWSSEHAVWSSLEQARRRAPGRPRVSRCATPAASRCPTAWWIASAHGARSLFTSVMTLCSALMSLAREVLVGRSVRTVISTITEDRRPAMVRPRCRCQSGALVGRASARAGSSDGGRSSPVDQPLGVGRRCPGPTGVWPPPGG